MEAQGSTYGPFCQNNNYFYFACLNDTKFLGCCADENACADSCSNGQLVTMAVDLDYVGSIHEQECQSGSKGYAGIECFAFAGTFVGCCRDATAAYCEVAPAFLSTNTVEVLYFSYPIQKPRPQPIVIQAMVLTSSLLSPLLLPSL